VDAVWSAIVYCHIELVETIRNDKYVLVAPAGSWQRSEHTQGNELQRATSGGNTVIRADLFGPSFRCLAAYVGQRHTIAAQLWNCIVDNSKMLTVYNVNDVRKQFLSKIRADRG
jgi:hypothetical protein